MINSYTHEYNKVLLKRIKEKRAELINLATSHELSSTKVVNCSQELDQLIYEIIKNNIDANQNSLTH